MLAEYRAWLESELKLLSNASHHAYSFGQANMAQRAIERLDAAVAGKTALTLSPDEVTLLAKALGDGTGDGLGGVRAQLASALVADGGPS